MKIAICFYGVHPDLTNKKYNKDIKKNLFHIILRKIYLITIQI